MTAIDATTISRVTDVLLPERQLLLTLLGELSSNQWEMPTECPEYTVKGIASHVLGDDFSLLSRQRDDAVQGLVLVAEKMPGVDLRTLLDTFNDQWVEASRFFSPLILIELLRLSGEWTAQYYADVDPASPGEPVALFAPADGSSPFWQAIAREFLERWTHHSQIRRALGRPSLADSDVLALGVDIIATVAQMPVTAPNSTGGSWAIGPMILGPTAQAADILTLRHTESEVTRLVDGPNDIVALFAERVGRRA